MVQAWTERQEASGRATRAQMTVGLVQIAQEYWARPPHREFRIRNGVLEPKPDGGLLSPEPVSFLPYAVGCLQAYAQTHAPDPSRYRWLPPVYQRRPVPELVAALAEADIVGFSTYVWNLRQNLAVARELKRLRPDRIIVFGGPQVPARAEAFLRENPFVDVACHGEAEAVFLDLLEAAGGRSWSRVPSTSHIARDGRFVSTPSAPRTRDLGRFPSPYLKGVFDDLMQAAPGRRWLGMWETNRGCPYSCAYCDWGSAVASKVHRFEMDRLAAEMEWFAMNDIHYLYICDANFGILPRDVEIARRLVETYERHDAFVSISIQNAKNQVERTYEIQKVFMDSRSATFAVNIAMQGVAEQTLKAIRRDNIPLEKFLKLQQDFRREGLETYTDMIVGLPGETYDSFADGLDQIIRNGQHNRIECYNCSILVNAEMGDPAYQAQYGLRTTATRIVYQYDAVSERDGDIAGEFVDTITSTDTLDEAGWRRARVYAWLAELLHFDRLLQMPFIVMAEHLGFNYRRLIEAFAGADPVRHPVVGRILGVLQAHASAIQAGAPDFIPSPKYLGVWWPVDQFVLVKMVALGELPRFYEEATSILLELLDEARRGEGGPVILEALRLIEALVRVPGRLDDVEVRSGYNLLEFYKGVLDGSGAPLRKTSQTYRIDRTSTVWLYLDDWASNVILNGRRPSQYVYPVAVATPASAVFPWLVST